MKHSPTSVLFFLFAISRAVWALKVTPGSHCAESCLDSQTGNPFKASDSTTKPTDVSCKDIDYSTTDTGIKFRKCLECLQTSKKVDQEESDLKWYIYNLRYTITTCLFSEPAAPPNGTVHSPCDIGQACKPLKAPMTGDGVKPVPNSTWGYCTANDGVFMGPNLSPCISCLQATEGEAYLSNFMTALEAGCKQDPEDGHILGISGSVFSTNAINITDPSAESKNSQGGLPPSAVAGIVIGVVFVFLAAAALFTVHWRREKTFKDWDRVQYYGSHSTSPGSYLPRDDVKPSQAHRRYYTGNAFNDKVAPPYTSSGDYYDHVEAEIQASGRNHASDPRSRNRRPDNDMPTHKAYRPQTDSRMASHASLVRPPSPPAATHKPERTNTPDSFAVQAYLTAAEDSARLAAQAPPPAPEPKPRVSRVPKIPSLTLPSLPKLRIPKKYKHVKTSHETMTPGGVHRGHEMDISNPVMNQDARFHDRPVGGPAAVPRERPASPRQQNIIYYNDEYIEVPLRSGKSTLYGY